MRGLFFFRGVPVRREGSSSVSDLSVGPPPDNSDLNSGCLVCPCALRLGGRMRLKSRFLFVSYLGTLLLAVPTYSQQSRATNAQRDASAMAILRQSIGQMGGASSTQVVDVTINGEVSQQKATAMSSGTIQIKMIGRDMCKVQIRDEDGQTTHIVSGTRMRRIRSNEDRVSPMHASLNHHLQYVPILSNLLDISDPNLTVLLVGEESLDDKTVYHIHTEKVYPGQTPEEAALLANLTSTDYFIDTRTFLLEKRSQRLPSLQDARSSLLMEFRYSDYRAVAGILIPYSLSVYVNDQKNTEIHLNSVETNTGVNPQEFEVTP